MGVFNRKKNQMGLKPNNKTNRNKSGGAKTKRELLRATESKAHHTILNKQKLGGLTKLKLFTPSPFHFTFLKIFNN